MTQDDLNLVLDALKWCHGGEPCGTAEAIAVVEKALAQPEQFCDANCVWTDHHPDCKLAQTQEPAAYWKEHAQGMQRDYDLLLADYEKLTQPLKTNSRRKTHDTD